METILSDAVVEEFCEEYERVTSPTEASLIAKRIIHVGKIVDFTNEQWGCLLHYQQECHIRLEAI